VKEELQVKFGCNPKKLSFFPNGVEIADYPPNANFSELSHQFKNWSLPAELTIKRPGVPV